VPAPLADAVKPRTSGTSTVVGAITTIHTDGEPLRAQHETDVRRAVPDSQYGEGQHRLIAIAPLSDTATGPPWAVRGQPVPLMLSGSMTKMTRTWSRPPYQG
jgi:hypothetical protein